MRFGVFTNNRCKAEKFINEFIRNNPNFSEYRKVIDRFSIRVTSKEGDYIRWINTNINNIRGQKFDKIWVDKNLIDDPEIMQHIRVTTLDDDAINTM